MKVTKVGSWRITGNVGKGGQASVFKGERTGIDGTKQSAAIKLIEVTSADAQRAAQLLAHESGLLRRLSSPHVARVLDDGWEEIDGKGYAWMATELIKGDDLQNEINQFGPLAKQQWLELAFDIFSGLAAAHQDGIIHCDLKPANVLRDSRRSVLIDFGMASFVRVVDPGDFGGSTPGYEAPEQLDGRIANEDLEYPVDLFSAGATLVFAATGWLPWDIPNQYRQALQAMNSSPNQQNYNNLMVAREMFRRDIVANAPRLDGLDDDQTAVVEKLLSAKPSERGSAAQTLEKIKAMLPEGSDRKSQTTDYAVRKAVSPGSMTPSQPRAERAARVQQAKQKAEAVNRQSEKSFATTLMLATWFGFLGADRWYLGKYVTAYFKLGTFGGYGIWWAVEAMMTARGEIKDKHGSTLKGTPKELSAAAKQTKKKLALAIPLVITSFFALIIFAPRESASSTDSNSTITYMPNLKGMNVYDAEMLLEGIEVQEYDATGESRSVIVRSNWQVCDQSVKAGSAPIPSSLTLFVVKNEEVCP